MARELFSANAETQEQAFLRLSQILNGLKKTYMQGETSQTHQIIQNMDELSRLGLLAKYMRRNNHFYFKKAMLNYDIELVNHLFKIMPKISHFAMFTQLDLWRFSQGAIKLSYREYSMRSEAIRQILKAIFVLEVRNDPENQTFVVGMRRGLQEQEPSYQAFVADLNAAAAEAKAVYDQEEAADTSNSRSPHLFGSHSVSQANHTGVNLSFRK